MAWIGSKTKKTRAILDMFCILILFLLVLGCGRGFDFGTHDAGKPTPASFTSPPTYPSARNVTSRVENPESFEPTRWINFETSDDPGKVLDYYRRVLEQEEWTPASLEPEAPDTIHYLFYDGRTLGFRVTAQRVLDKDTPFTSVELRLTSTRGL